MNMTVLIQAAVSTVLAILMTGFGVSAASAHSDTFSSIPAAGSTSASVSQIQFTFAEQVLPKMSPEVVLRNDAGMTIATSDPKFDITNSTMTVTVVSGALPNGSYKATYRVASKDGHTATGVLSFTVAGSSAAAIALDGGSPTPIPFTLPQQQGNDVPLLSLILSSAAVILILAAVIVVIARRRKGKF